MNSEKLLTRSLVAALTTNKRPARRTHVMREVDCYLGVADVVAIQWSHAFWKGLAPKRIVPLTSPGPAHVYALIGQRRAVSLDELVLHLGLTRRTILNHLLSLRRAKLVRPVKDGTYRIGAAFPHRALRITAYEAKIEKWQRALYQAARYWSFANRVYVVLPLSRANRLLAKKRVFRSVGVGLIGVSKDGILRELVKSAYQAPRSSIIRLRVAAKGVLSLTRGAKR